MTKNPKTISKFLNTGMILVKIPGRELMSPYAMFNTETEYWKAKEMVHKMHRDRCPVLVHVGKIVFQAATTNMRIQLEILGKEEM